MAFSALQNLSITQVRAPLWIHMHADFSFSQLVQASSPRWEGPVGEASAIAPPTQASPTH